MLFTRRHIMPRVNFPDSANYHRKAGLSSRLFVILLLTPSLGLVVSPRVHGQQQRNGMSAVTARKATLQELYAMFFIYAAHVESRSNADKRAGLDRTDYRLHLQRASGLTDDEYAIVLSAAHNYAAVDADVKAQIGEEIGEVAANEKQINALFQQRDSALHEEITNLRQLLGSERAEAFEAYLRNDYIKQGAYPQPAKMQVSSPQSPSSSSSFTTPLSSTQLNSKAAIRNMAASGAPVTNNTTTDAVTVTGSQECQTYYTAEYDGYFTVCADSQLSYVGSGQVEPYAAMYATWINVAFDYLEIQGEFYVNGVFENNLGCYSYYPTGNSCEHSPSVLLNSGNGALYQWYGVTTMGAYDVSCSDPDDCYETVGSMRSDPAEVQIFFPDIASVTPSTLSGGESGTIIIDGEGLISPFLNTPIVTVTDQAQVFRTFSVQAFDYATGTITVSYSVASSAPAGTQTITVNNGFGTDTAEITINASPPAAAILDGLYAGNQCQGTSIANPTGGDNNQNIVVGQLVQFTACVPSSIASAVESSSWSVNDGSFGDHATAGFNPVLSSTNSSAPYQPVVETTTCNSGLSYCDYGTSPNAAGLYFVTQGSYTFTFTYTLSNGATSVPASVTYVVGGPVANGYAISTPPQGWQTVCEGSYLLCANTAETEVIEPRLGTDYLDFGGSQFSNNATAPTGNAGAYQFIQILSPRLDIFLDSNGQATCPGSAGLDNTYPFPSTDGFATDEPGIPLASSCAGGDDPSQGEVSDAFGATMYLLWDPSLNASGVSTPGCAATETINDQGLPGTPKLSTCTGSIPTPLASITWGYCGGAINTLMTQSNGTTWILQCNVNVDNPLVPVYSDAESISTGPAWTYVHVDN
ncbi:hypothetical protein [Paracidobacterium acidisoli]|uniref:hypothetical protein n=1 Tax=Paracidobacterium acidisoli TaxID=2303751 RepID=UPI0011C0D9BC|nr:hypothetical protein [Paracidobacterium acidisoli]MBT9332953.1 hypothetical protein [Paracidobacterium acidisoli]